MVLGCILVCCESGKSKEVVEKMGKVKSVKKAFSVHGRWDIVTEIEVSDMKTLGEVVLKFHGLPGVKATETLINF